VVDVSKKQLERMEAVQVSFFRRLKRRGRKTPKALFGRKQASIESDTDG
jgi:hypothetical protein